LSNWIEFETYNGANRSYRFEDLTAALIESFETFHYDFKNNKFSTVGRDIKSLKRVFGRFIDQMESENARREKKGDSEIYRASELNNARQVIRKAVKPKNGSNKIALSQDEVNKIAALDDLPDHLERVRDLFLIGVFTAFRWSEYSKLNRFNVISKDINGKKVKLLRLIADKTGKETIIPISPKLDVLLSKYEYRSPDITMQYMNRTIKEIAKRAGLTDMVVISDVENGSTSSREVPKYSLVSSHTARKTAVTLLYLQGMVLMDIMQITRHSSIKQLQAYINIGQAESLSRIVEHDYFKGPALKVV